MAEPAGPGPFAGDVACPRPCADLPATGVSRPLRTVLPMLLRALLPVRCPGCAELVATGAVPCTGCAAGLPRPRRSPARRARRLLVAVRLRGRRQALVTGLKYRRDRAALGWLAGRMAALVVRPPEGW